MSANSEFYGLHNLHLEGAGFMVLLLLAALEEAEQPDRFDLKTYLEEVTIPDLIELYEFTNPQQNGKDWWQRHVVNERAEAMRP